MIRASAPLRRAAAATAFAAIAGCATVAPTPEPGAFARPDASFDIAGRLSARRGADGVAAHFAWSHAEGRDRIDVATPTGQVIARMERDTAGIRVLRPNEAATAFADWGALTRDVLGVAIPVDGLAAWVQGAPAPGAGYGIERDAVGRPLVLRQQGWEIVYAYADASAPARPSRLVMRYPDSEPVEVRVVVDRWSLADARP